MTPLHVAVSQGHLQVVQGLLDAGAGNDEARGRAHPRTSLGGGGWLNGNLLV